MCAVLPIEHQILMRKLLREQQVGGRYGVAQTQFVFEVLSSYFASVMVRLTGEELRALILEARESNITNRVPNVVVPAEQLRGQFAPGANKEVQNLNRVAPVVVLGKNLTRRTPKQ